MTNRGELEEPARKLAQAMWDALGILGEDLDGDEAPEGAIAAMGVDAYVSMFLGAVQEFRDDYDDLLAEVEDADEEEEEETSEPAPT